MSAEWRKSRNQGIHQIYRWRIGKWRSYCKVVKSMRFCCHQSTPSSRAAGGWGSMKLSYALRILPHNVRPDTEVKISSIFRDWDGLCGKLQLPITPEAWCSGHTVCGSQQRCKRIWSRVICVHVWPCDPVNTHCPIIWTQHHVHIMLIAQAEYSLSPKCSKLEFSNIHRCYTYIFIMIILLQFFTYVSCIYISYAHNLKVKDNLTYYF